MQKHAHFTGQRCYEKLRSMLLYGQIPPGTRLCETTWSERLGVHRTALREALAILAIEGLLKRGVRGGMFAADGNEPDPASLHEMRLVLERGALNLLSRRRPPSPQGLRALDRVSRVLESLLSEGLLLGFIEADARFHQILVDLAGNQRLKALHRQSVARRFPPLAMDVDALPEWAARTVAEHAAISRSLARGDYLGAGNLLEAHLTGAAHPDLRSVVPGPGGQDRPVEPRVWSDSGVAAEDGARRNCG